MDMVSGILHGSLAHHWRALLAPAPVWDPPAVPTLVVVPHPDDEVLSTGGLISRQRARGVQVRVLAVTDGEAAYPDQSTLAAVRRAEQISALHHLGVPEHAVRRLGLPDGAAADHEQVLADHIAAQASDCGLIVAPWTGDHHPDHEACGRAAVKASLHTGAVLVHGLFWAWHHASAPDLAGLALVRMRMDEEEQRRRTRALTEHRSQITTDLVEVPILSPTDLEPAGWAAEYYIRAVA
ncbi:MAG: PIG-L deacetylase family protein [Euzebya sp.]